MTAPLTLTELREKVQEARVDAIAYAGGASILDALIAAVRRHERARCRWAVGVEMSRHQHPRTEDVLAALDALQEGEREQRK